MADPSPEVVAAALALAREVSLYQEMFTDERERSRQWPDKVVPKLLAYRAAIAPKRTRAETAEGALAWLEKCSDDFLRRIGGPPLVALCREETAPEPDRKPALTCAECGLTSAREPTVAMRWDDVVRCNDCASKRPAVPEPEDSCGCEASDALRERLANIKTELALWHCGKKVALDVLRAVDALAREP